MPQVPLQPARSLRLLQYSTMVRPRLFSNRWPLVLMASTVGPIAIGYGITRFSSPIANDSVRGSKGFVTLLNPAQVSARLRENEESFLIDRGNGVLRYDFGQLASNQPIEDDHSERIVSVPLVSPDDMEYSTDWHFWGIYDGHGGWSTSAKLRETLIAYTTRELDQVYSPVAPRAVRRFEPTDPAVVDEALKTAFVKLDNDIVYKSVDKLLQNPTKKEALETIPPALSGSCGLLALFDSHSQYLRVAVAGDSRAVLGFQQPSGQWQAKSLTTDQTGSNEDEVRRIRSEHPGEDETSVKRGRVLGIYEPTRSFGDAITKWSPETQRKLAQQFFSRGMPHNLRTPPYMTAEPVVTRTKLDMTRPTFLVMASDGLFELLSNDQVVSLVVDWLQAKRPESLSSILREQPKPNQGWLSPLLGRRSSTKKRQLGDSVEDVSENKDSQKAPVRSSRKGPHEPSLNVSITDNNVATHLIRNALGGADDDQVSMFVSIPSPLSRKYRDDLTVTVVFFGQGNQQETATGKVRLNVEGTHPPKAKL